MFKSALQIAERLGYKNQVSVDSRLLKSFEKCPDELWWIGARICQCWVNGVSCTAPQRRWASELSGTQLRVTFNIRVNFSVRVIIRSAHFSGQKTDIPVQTQF